MATGTLLHTAILEPEDFERRYKAVTLERLNPRDKAYQEAERAAQGRLLVKQADFDEALYIRDAVLAHPVARELITPDLIVERSFAWHDPATGVLCRGRGDGINLQQRAFIDLKSCQDASHEAFAKAAHGFRYHWQHALYSDGMTKADGWRPDAFVFLCFEKQEPYLTAAYEIGARELTLAQDEIAAVLPRYADSLARDYWPGHSDFIETLSFPHYAFT